jgi:hypothetical protein
MSETLTGTMLPLFDHTAWPLRFPFAIVDEVHTITSERKRAAG